MSTRRHAAEALGAPVSAIDAGAGAAGRGSAVLLGVAAGVAFVVLEVACASLVLGAAPRAALRSLPAAALGDAHAGAYIVTLAAVASIVLAAAYGALVAFAVRRFSRATAWWTGAVSGLTVYVVNFYYLLAPALRWSGELRDQMNVLSPWYLVSLWP